VLRDDLLEA
nr:Chain P, arginine variant HA-1 peptide [synthetic construct]